MISSGLLRYGRAFGMLRRHDKQRMCARHPGFRQFQAAKSQTKIEILRLAWLSCPLYSVRGTSRSLLRDSPVVADDGV